MNIRSLLFMTGYLTFTEAVEDSELNEYYLRLPNKEDHIYDEYH